MAAGPERNLLSPQGSDRTGVQGMETGAGLRIAIVGAGACGTLLAIHLLRQSRVAVDVTLIERGVGFGRGAAYSSPNPAHTLNVLAHMMGGEAEADVDGFVRWLAPRQGTAPEAIRNDYPARWSYGDYLQDLLANAESDHPGRLRRLRGEVFDLTPGGASRYTLRLADGTRIEADHVALCLGNLDPGRFLPASDPRFVDTPWRPGALAGIGPAERLLIVGTGLTRVDTVLDLLVQGHTGPMIAVSRHGQLPREDALSATYPDFFSPAIATRGIAAVMKAVRREVQEAAARGIGWHGVIEAFRVHTSAIWKNLDETNRRRFLRHLRSLWFVYRHRLPPQHMRRLDALRAAGRLTIRAGRLVTLSPGSGGIAVTIRPRGAATGDVSHVDRVINCTGPEGDYARSTLPLVRSLIAQGLARPDDYRLGLDIDEDFTLLRADGTRAEGLVTLGPPTRGRFWEVTAVPHLRRQVEAFVARLVATHNPGETKISS